MSSAQRFSTGREFSWQGQLYQVRRLLPGSQLNIVHVETEEAQTVPFITLYKALVAGQVQFLLNGKPVKRLYKSDYIDLSDCPADLKAVAEYRQEVIRPLLGLALHERYAAIKARVKELKEQFAGEERSPLTAISRSSVYRWLSDYINSGGDLRALIPVTEKRGGKAKTRVETEVETIIKTTIGDLFYVREKRSIDYIHREITVRIVDENKQRPPDEQLTLPSRATIARRIADLDVEGKITAKRGKRAAKRELTQYEQMEYPTVPLARVEIDHTRADIVVIDETDLLPLGRLTLTHALDTATRYPLGYYLGFEPPSYLTIMECLYHTILPKENVRERYGTQHDWIAYGIPFELNVDNGKDFIGRDLDDACETLGITLHRLPMMTPYFKAGIERMFGTLNTGLLHGLPGTTFSNTGHRGDYDSLKQACITLDELDKMTHIFILDIYAETFHKGLQGIPARHWEETLRNGFFPRGSTAEELRILLGRVESRTIMPYGIDFHLLRYNCSDLTPLRTRMLKRKDRQVKVKYNPADISRIHVYDPDEKVYIEVPALAQKYTEGLSLWKHEVICNFALSEKKTVNIEDLGRAQRKIQEIVEESLKRKTLSTRSKIARWQQNQAQPASEPAAPAPGNTAPLPDVDLDLSKLEAAGWGITYTQSGGTDDRAE